LLASRLQEQLRLAILTRGFRSQIEKRKEIQRISLGKGSLFPAVVCGDEPYFLSQKTHASIWVGADRVKSGQMAIESGANCLLLDDGMQHRRLKRDFEIVLIDAKDPLSKGRFLPLGLLRDSPKRLRNATLVVVNHLQDEAHFQQMQKQLAPLTPAPLVGTQIEILNKTHFSPRKVGVFCGIGKPERFLQSVRDLNQEIVDTLVVKDHGSLHSSQLETFAKNCRMKGAELLLCTEKDFVKLPPKHSLCLNITPVEIQLKIIAGQEHWESLIENILDKVVK
jgi:tetraacyldisaccharide 4'-kinase